ncbi:DEAD/DEAH box helicase [Variovorax sp. LT2P21]|uniref:DEAD/DEAH box helicase n=1 Tax=Variovorax sp. LT2P21 TaxID=3443731 RepID=UPI003F45EB56
MAVLIPSFGASVSRMTTGERRLAERLEQKLDSDYLLWYDVPVGPKRSHPDFIVLHPLRGLLILEVKDWRLETIQKATRGMWEIVPGGELKSVNNPFEQARHYAEEVVDALKRDPQLVQPSGKWQGMLTFPWSYGVVFSHITRRQFEASGLNHAIDGHRVLCADEMQENADPEDLQSRLWGMFPTLMRGALTLPQIDRVRWLLFPEVRVNSQRSLFDGSDPGQDEAAERALPSILSVMDLQQEQLARSLGDGHRVIHGVAGSGKTMILGYRAEFLAQAASAAKPVLVLCYNEPLAVKLASVMEAKGLSERVHVRNFHKWCRQQLVAFGQELPPQKMATGAKMDDMVDRVIRAVDRKHIPSGQYLAVLIDEGHDFRPEWLKLVTQMVDPSTNSLLLLYDDAQSIYERQRSKQFSFKSVGIQAQGRTTVLKINYRNTRQILQTASQIAGGLLTAENSEQGEDGIPLLLPVSCGREGPEPMVINLPTLHEEAAKVAELLSAAHQEGHAWGDMAVLCRHHDGMEECARALTRRRLPHQVRKGSGDFKPLEDSIKVMTMHVSKGLEFPIVAVMGLNESSTKQDEVEAEARLLYVAATRATQRLLIATAQALTL